MTDKSFPETIAGVTEYMKVARARMPANLSEYGIFPSKFEVATSLYGTDAEKAATEANPNVATTGGCRARNIVRDNLEPRIAGITA